MAHGGGFSSNTTPGAIWNVVICGIICIAAPVTALLNAERGSGYVAAGIVVGVIAVGLEISFVRRLLAVLRSR
ncbi:hypothetical protein DEJ23_14690 [Curtobacterium sp. MCSS17_008]|uniref:hypothetical protein n=1 Tax=Curtobacterium sp. MCSS17_008 TaxID=2175647 RepID=UPI000DAA55F3|nr:hypothetical protein [Curtobacterium sp. MCSS17_008]PZF53322.1 hypothetical protein DEJ23_14690 [Curtobacterium sp. MCSS17_008]